MQNNVARLFCNNILLLITSFLTHSISQYTRHRHKIKKIFFNPSFLFPHCFYLSVVPFYFLKVWYFLPFSFSFPPCSLSFSPSVFFLFVSPPLSLSGHLHFLCLPLVFVCSSLSLSAISFSSYRSLSLSPTHSLTHSGQGNSELSLARHQS